MGIHSHAPHEAEQVAPATPENIVALHTVEEVASQLRVSRSKIYALIESGRLTAHRLPAIRVSDDDLQEFLGECRSSSRQTLPRTQTIKLKHLR